MNIYSIVKIFVIKLFNFKSYFFVFNMLHVYFIRFCCEVEQLPQGTSVEIWQILVQKCEDNFLCHMSNDATSK